MVEGIGGQHEVADRHVRFDTRVSGSRVERPEFDVSTLPGSGFPGVYSILDPEDPEPEPRRDCEASVHRTQVNILPNKDVMRAEVSRQKRKGQLSLIAVSLEWASTCCQAF